jgi:hypothetical protein
MRHAFLVLIAISLTANAAPLPLCPPRTVEPSPAIPVLAGQWMGGYWCEQDGRAIQFKGWCWGARGWIDAKGDIFLWWESSDAVATGVYRYDPDTGELRGHWNYVGEVGEANIPRHDLMRRLLVSPDP